MTEILATLSGVRGKGLHEDENEEEDEGEMSSHSLSVLEAGFPFVSQLPSSSESSLHLDTDGSRGKEERGIGMESIFGWEWVDFMRREEEMAEWCARISSSEKLNS